VVKLDAATQDRRGDGGRYARIHYRCLSGEASFPWADRCADCVVAASGYASLRGEILVSVPALEFAYTQAPKKMKSLIMAAYLAGSISLGNYIASRIIWVLALKSIAPYVTGAKAPTNYYWVFLGLMIVATLLYAIYAAITPTTPISWRKRRLQLLPMPPMRLPDESTFNLLRQKPRESPGPFSLNGWRVSRGVPVPPLDYRFNQVFNFIRLNGMLSEEILRAPRTDNDVVFQGTAKPSSGYRCPARR